MDCFPVVRASVETCGILVVPTLAVFPGGLVGASVPEVLVGTEALVVCIVAALGDTTKLPLLSAVTTGIMVLGKVVVAAAGVASFTTAGVASVMLVGGAPGLFVTVSACGWVVSVLTAGLGVAVTVGAGVVMAAVVFAAVGLCVDSFSNLVVAVIPPVLGLLLMVGSVLDLLPLVGADVTEFSFFDTEVAL